MKKKKKKKKKIFHKKKKNLKQYEKEDSQLTIKIT